jgi:wyosine [tRNA(Phe)-imidazoG37] synthetase (radical SAM superfamily)
MVFPSAPFTRMKFPAMSGEHPREVPRLVYANGRGEIVDFPELAMAGRSGNRFVQPALDDLIPLPEGSELFLLPGRLPVDTDPAGGEPLKLAEDPEEPGAGIQAVAAFMTPAHTAVYTAAFEKTAGAPLLPLFAYTAVGWLDGRFWVAGFRSDADPRQEAAGFDCERIERSTRLRLRAHPDNRLIQHLGICSLTYSCPAAKNYFLDRYEAPLPTSPTCNARCLGCISLQPSDCCPSTQERIKFVPTPAEIAEVAVPHLEKVEHGVVSFGQGCEGEPLLQAKTIEQAVRLIRKETGKGTVNLNSNASLPDKVARLAAAGLDSIRVSLNSARPEFHARYYRPHGFTFEDVCSSIDAMKEAGRFVSLNYFILPGFTDDPEEFAALRDLVARHRPDFIQLRNLNMDPDWYLEALAHRPMQEPLGIRLWLAALKKEFPYLRFGYFNPPLR